MVRLEYRDILVRTGGCHNIYIQLVRIGGGHNIIQWFVTTGRGDINRVDRVDIIQEHK